MQSDLASVDSYEETYHVDQRTLPGRNKPARRYSPRYERSHSRPTCRNGAQFRSNKERGL